MTSLSHEPKEIVNIDCQCDPLADPLFAQFRADISCFTLRKFQERGLTKDELLQFQKKYPIIYPWDENYDFLRFDVNRRFNIFPWMIIMANEDKDLLFGLELAKKHKIPLSLRSGSHSFEGFSLVEGIVLDQSRRKKLWLNKKTKTFTSESGMLLGPLATELSKCGLFEPSGTCANNGLFGMTLGGGIGFTSRKYGLTCDNLLEADVILANGKTIKVNDKEHRDLFWACKGGGGGNFGIVTKMKFQAYPINKVYTYTIEIELTEKNLAYLLPLWQKISLDFPDNLCSDFNIFRRKIEIAGLYLGKNEEELRKILAPFISYMGYMGQTKILHLTYVKAMRYFTGTGRWKTFYKIKSSFLTLPLPESALPIILKYCLDPKGTFRIGLLGGKISAVKPDETAFAYRNSSFSVMLNSQWENEDQELEFLTWITNFYNELAKYFPGHVYVNSPDLAIPNYLAQYYGQNLKRLIEVKKIYDPENTFRYPQSIPTEY